MKRLKTFLLVRNLIIIFLLQNLFRLVHMDAIITQSEVVFNSNGDTLNVELQSSETDQLIQGGTNIIINVTMLYSTASPSFLSQTLFVDVHLPSEFNIDSVQSLKVIQLADTDYTIDSTYTASQPSVEFQISFETITWKGFTLINASVSEKVVPRQLLNITADVEYDGDSKQLWIGSYAVPGLEYPELVIRSTDFRPTQASLLTDEERINVTAKFLVPSVTTNIKVFVQFPVFGGSIPVSINYANVSTMSFNVQSANLQNGSGIGSNIVLSEATLTLVTFDFGETITSPGAVENSVTLMITGIVDCVGRHDVYAQGSFGNITSWLVYSTALGDETIQCSQWIETELGEPQVKYDMRFERDSGNIEGALLIRPVFEFYNPAFATENTNVTLNVELHLEYMIVLNYNVYVCEFPVDSPLNCQNASSWRMMNVTNTSRSIHVQITNLTVGYGVYGEGETWVLRSVPATTPLDSEMNIEYWRERWSLASEVRSYNIKTKRIALSASVTSSSVHSTSQTRAAIGEKFTCEVKAVLPVSTNEGFMILIMASGNSVIYGNATFIYVGENLSGYRLERSTELNITTEGSVVIPKNTQVFFGEFGTVRNNGSSTDADASYFILEVSFFVKNVDDNVNSEPFTFIPTIFHNPVSGPSFSKSSQPSLTFEVVEPALTGSLLVTPSRNVSENTELSFTATIRIDPASTSTAFNLVVLLTIPFPHINLTEYSSATGTLRTVPGNESPKQLLRPEDINSTTLVYEIDEVTQSTTVINYKTRTSETLAASIAIIPSFVMFYSSLPKNLNQSLAREYSYILESQPIIFTFRPDSFLNLSLSHNERQVDTDDVLNITIDVRNVGVGSDSPTAYDVKIIMPLSKTLFRNTSIVCNEGSFGKNTSSEYDTLMADTATIIYKDELKCSVETTLNAAVVLLQRMVVNSTLTYHGLPTAHQHEYDGYSLTAEDEVFIKTFSADIELSAFGNMSKVLYNGTLGCTLNIVVPEGIRSSDIRVEFEIPTIPGYKRKRRRKRATEIRVLVPDISQTSYVSSDNLVIGSMNHFFANNIYTLEFKNITNEPENMKSDNDILTVVVMFLVANEPELLVGRSYNVTSTLFYPGGTVVRNMTFTVVGNLGIAVLQIAKSVKVLDASVDSPSVIFFVNISHTPESESDAFDVNIADFIKGMNVIRDDEFPGTIISSPSNNVYQISTNIPRIELGSIVIFYYRAQFNIEVKTPKYVQEAASLTWIGPQVNSPTYGPLVNSDACVARNDMTKERIDWWFDLLVFFIFLGLFLGFLLVFISVCVFIQCCRKGRLVPYYRIFPSQTSCTILDEETKPSSVPTHASVRAQSVLYIISSDDTKKLWNELENVQGQSVLYILYSDGTKVVWSELEQLDIQDTQRLDCRMENSSQFMFLRVFEHLLTSLHQDGVISKGEVKLYTKEIHAGLEEIHARNHQEYKRRLRNLHKKMKLEGKWKMKKLNESKQREIEEAKSKLNNANKKKTTELLHLVDVRYQSLEDELRAQIQLEHDVEKETIKKDLSVNTRLSSKELQGNLLNEILTKAKKNQEEAGMIISEYFSTIAGVEKMHDAEKSRQAMALEMRLEERNALAQQVRDEQEQQTLLLSAIQDRYNNDVDELVNSSQISLVEARTFRKKLMNDGEILHKKLEKQRKRQEQNLHNRLTHLKRKKLKKKFDEYQLALNKLDQNKDFGSVKHMILARQELIQRYNIEIEEMERELDKHDAQILKNFLNQHAEKARTKYKKIIKCYYKGLMKRSGTEEEYCRLMNLNDKEVTRILVSQHAQQNKQKTILEEKLNKKREILTEKMKGEKKEVDQIRQTEQNIFQNMMDGRESISKDEREKILREHEHNLVRLESSLTLNKLQQKRMLEEQLEKRLEKKMARLKKSHENENMQFIVEDAHCGKDKSDLLKKQEIEKLRVLKNDANFMKEIELIRDEMLKARLEDLRGQNDSLEALIAELQNKMANQIAEINKELRASGLLETSILDELEDKKVVLDEETKKVLLLGQEKSEEIEKVLRRHHDEQEMALKNKLRRKLGEKEEELIQEHKDELARNVDRLEGKHEAATRLQLSLSVKEKEDVERQREEIEKEIDESINDMNLQCEVNRLKAIEKQSLQFILALIKCGKIHEAEKDAVFQVVFPAKKREEIDDLLHQIYGYSYRRRSSTARRRRSSVRDAAPRYLNHFLHAKR